MKYALLALSVICLSFTFVKNSDLTDDNIPQGITATSPDEPGSITPGKGAKTTSVSSVVTAALAFKATLTASQQSALQLTYTTALARKWSNLPCGATCRNGVQFGTFSSAQLAAAQDLIKAALGSNANDGYSEWEAIRLGEAYLHANGGGNGYDTTLRWIAFLNTPSDTGAWMLQFGGHHYAANIAVNKGHVIGATPYFMGLEPRSFTWNGTTYAPLNDEHDALTAMLASLSSTQLTSAKLSQSFSDCYMIPGETNGGQATFPAKAGVLCNSLTLAQKNLVLAVIQHYTGDMDTAAANSTQAVYASQLDNTYISFVGNSATAGNASTFLVNQGDYARIDGPTVWIEFSCQGGIVIQGQVHYHTVWRDHSHDYGIDLTGAPIDVRSSTSVAAINNAQPATIFPNPAAGRISIVLPKAVTDATMRIVNAASGQTVWKSLHSVGAQGDVDISRFASGVYYLYITDANGATFSGKFVKQ